MLRVPPVVSFGLLETTFYALENPNTLMEFDFGLFVNHLNLDSCILCLIVLYYNYKETTAPLQGADQFNTKQKFHPINGQVEVHPKC